MPSSALSSAASPAPRPPFRADHVGSLLRPPALSEARRAHRAGTLDAATLKEIEDREIATAVRRQKECGLKLATDGEMRRAAWQWDFLEGLDGTTASVGQIAGDATAAPKIIRVTGRLGFSTHPMLEHFRFLKSTAEAAGVLPKMTIPSPTMLVSAMRNWRAVVDAAAYPEIGALYADLGDAYRGAIAAFYDAGCRYLQLDDCNLAYLCDPACREQMRARGDDPDAMLRDWIAVINRALTGRPADLTVATHICHGNFRSRWFSQGGYEPIAEAIFGALDYDGFFLEYDSERSGGFEPLRFVPKDKRVVLGLVTTKTGALEAKDQIRRRIDEAARFVARDQLCLSPQCGFASTEEGNDISVEAQWQKLARVAEIAAEVWP